MIVLVFALYKRNRVYALIPHMDGISQGGTARTSVFHFLCNSGIGDR